jgi:hypothetical protein
MLALLNLFYRDPILHAAPNRWLFKTSFASLGAKPLALNSSARFGMPEKKCEDHGKRGQTVAQIEFS